MVSLVRRQAGPRPSARNANIVTKKHTIHDGQDTSHKNHKAYSVPGLQRGLRVLETIAEAQRALGIADIAKRLGLARSAVFRLTYTLRHMGFLETQGENRDFALGPRVLSIGYAFLASKNIIEVARPELERLRDETSVSSHLAIYSDGEVLYLSAIQTRSGFLSNMNVGDRLPAHASPLGWLLLSNYTSRELAEIYHDRTLKGLTAQTPTTVDALVARVAQAGAKGYVVSHGIVETGGISISAPVMDGSGQTVAAIDISGPESAFRQKLLEKKYLPPVLEAAARVSARLGHLPDRARRPQRA